MALVISPVQYILLADDDDDDWSLFNDVLEELFISPNLTWAKNGIQLMQILLKNDSSLPDIIFLDLNMPLKNGIECLKEIKEGERLKDIPVIIFSTSAQQWAVDTVYELKANLFIRKPDTYSKLKDVIQKILSIDWKNTSQPAQADFVIHP